MIIYMKKKLTNKRLVSYLMDHKHIDMISIDRDNIICTCSRKFLPTEVKPLLDETGQAMPKMSSDKDGNNFIIFPRY